MFFGERQEKSYYAILSHQLSEVAPMKTKQKILVSIVALVGCLSVPVFADEATVRKNANVDGNDRVDSIDMALLQREVTGLPMSHTAWVESPTTGDLNCDGDVGSLDMAFLQGYITNGYFSSSAIESCSKVSSEQIPSECSVVQQEGEAKKIYKCFSYYVVIADLRLTNVSFGNAIQSNYGGNSYYKMGISSWRRKLGNPFAVINGQFFNKDMNPTTLSFGLKSNGDIIHSEIATDPSDAKKKLRTLTINYTGKASVHDYANHNLIYKLDNKEAIVGLSPDENMSGIFPIGRNYMVVKENTDDKSTSSLYLFVARYMNQIGMERKIESWGLSLDNSIMMDGSGSSQLKTNKISYYGGTSKVKPDYRSLPNVISIR